MKFFKSALVALGLAAAIAAVTPASITAQRAGRNLDFTLINKTGLTIDNVYVSPSASDKWGEDVLGRDVLKHGESVDITFSRSETDCMWDIKIVDEDKDEVEWEKIDLCKAEEITLVYENKKPTAIIK